MMIRSNYQPEERTPDSLSEPGRGLRWWAAAVSWLVGIVAVWEILGRLLGIRADILPTPSRIALETWKEWPLVLSGAAITAAETGTALLWIGTVAAPMVTASLLIRPSARTSEPGGFLLKIVPVVAAAPVFLTWFGFGSPSKIVLASLMGLVPFLTRAMDGFSTVSPEVLGLMKLMGAPRWTLFRKVLLPGCVPHLLSGFRDGTALALLGVLVGEFVGAEAGLGHLIVLGYSRSNTPLMFSVLALLSAAVFSLHLLFGFLERLISRQYPASGTRRRP